MGVCRRDSIGKVRHKLSWLGRYRWMDGGMDVKWVDAVGWRRGSGRQAALARTGKRHETSGGWAGELALIQALVRCPGI